MSVGRICVREVDVVDARESAQTAARRMHSRKVGTLVVIDDKRRPVGVLTDRDLAVRVLAEAKDPTATNVDSLMTPLPKTVREDTPIEEALVVMRTGPFRRLPVVNASGELVGILSVDDILDLLAEEFGSIRKLLADESPSSLARA